MDRKAISNLNRIEDCVFSKLIEAQKNASSEDFNFDFKDQNGNVIGSLVGKITLKNQPPSSQVLQPSEPKSEFDAFISYSWGTHPEFANKPKVRKVYDELSKANFKCWLDQVQLEDKINLYGAMSQGILDSKAFICFIDKRYCESNSTINEFYFALYNKKLIIPVLCETLEDIIAATKNNPIAFNIPHRLFEKFYHDNMFQSEKTFYYEFYQRLVERMRRLLSPHSLERYANNLRLFNFFNSLIILFDLFFNKRPFENKNAGKPVQLIKIVKGKFLITDEGDKIIRNLKGQIGIITIVVSKK